MIVKLVDSLTAAAPRSPRRHDSARRPVIEDRKPPSGKVLAGLALAALGVVYGDIGTSPLYALKECFNGAHAVPLSPENVLGVLSLVFWSLNFVVSFKYIAMVLRADNRGEGGILALLALVRPRGPTGTIGASSC